MKISKEKNQLKAIIRDMPAAVAMFDKDVRYIAASEQWLKDYGVDHSILGKSHYEVFKNIPQSWKEIHKRALRGETLNSQEDHFIDNAGNDFWLRWNVKPWFDGDIIGGIIMQTDNITEAVEAKNLLEDANKKLKDAQKIAQIGSWHFDLQEQKITWSDQMFKMFPEDKKKGEPSFEDHLVSIHEEDRQYWLKTVEQCLEDGKPYTMKYRTQNNDGKLIWLEAHGQADFDKDGKIISLFGTCQDITKSVIQTKELQEAKIKAERLSATKSIFLANMSHEMRTPLNGIVGIIDLLEDAVGNEKIELLQILKQAGLNLTELINDILDFSKIESGAFKLNIEKNNLFNCVNEVIHLLKPMAIKKEIDFNLHFDLDHNQTFKFDHLRTKQILMNIVGNAIKFTEKGFVLVNVTEENSNIVIEVKDSGVGIEQSKTKNLFKSFSQADQGITKKFGGTGLGLAISKQLIDLMNGEILVESEYGVGTSFTLNLPFKKLDSKIESHSKDIKERSYSYHALIVEDNRINQVVITKLLDKIGCTYKLVDNGSHAIDIVKNEDFDIILMDIQMPVMDGYTATKEIRKFNNEVPIIACSANAFEEHIDQAKEVGMNYFIAKPINKQNLSECIENIGFFREVKKIKSS